MNEFSRVLPVMLTPGQLEPFPDADLADADGLIAVGGDLSVSRLLLAYDSGIFPWFSEENPELWWSPDPRAVVLPDTLHVSRTMHRFLRDHPFRITWNTAFDAVMHACAVGRDDGTWILPEMIDAYSELRSLGHAHSLEIWDGNELVGGLYGVHRGGLFAGESMFHRATNASKLALITAVRELSAAGVEVFDVQMMTPHLESMGARPIERSDYLALIRGLVGKRVDLAGL